jgi:hypothetical protein
VTNPCAVLIFDRKATSSEGRVVYRACGAPANSVIVMHGDHLFAVCGRHNGRLARAGVAA